MPKIQIWTTGDGAWDLIVDSPISEAVRTAGELKKKSDRQIYMPAN